jgi:hypothetical protein
MLKGTIVENSLDDKSILDKVQIIRTWKSGGCILHDVNIEESVALEVGKYLTDGPWYVHFWDPGQDKVLVVFRNKVFEILHSDRSTWTDAVAYGKSLGIPEQQLDFIID